MKTYVCTSPRSDQINHTIVNVGDEMTTEELEKLFEDEVNYGGYDLSSESWIKEATDAWEKIVAAGDDCTVYVDDNAFLVIDK